MLIWDDENGKCGRALRCMSGNVGITRNRFFFAIGIITYSWGCFGNIARIMACGSSGIA